MTAGRTLLRGRLLSFRRRPEGPGDDGSYDYVEDGALLLSGGRIEAMGDHASVGPQAEDAAVIDHRPHLILPGLMTRTVAAAAGRSRELAG